MPPRLALILMLLLGHKELSRDASRFRMSRRRETASHRLSVYCRAAPVMFSAAEEREHACAEADSRRLST